jgi:fluoroquinolone transport system permease protein
LSLISKSISLGIVAAAASFMIALATAGISENLPLMMMSVFLTSVFFTLYGFIVAAGCHTINQYFVKMVPFLLLSTLPCFSVIQFDYSWAFRVLPNVSGLVLILGAFRGIPIHEGILYILVICIWILLVFRLALRAYNKNIFKGGVEK